MAEVALLRGVLLELKSIFFDSAHFEGKQKKGQRTKTLLNPCSLQISRAFESEGVAGAMIGAGVGSSGWKSGIINCIVESFKNIVNITHSFVIQSG